MSIGVSLTAWAGMTAFSASINSASCQQAHHCSLGWGQGEKSTQFMRTPRYLVYSAHVTVICLPENWQVDFLVLGGIWYRELFPVWTWDLLGTTSTGTFGGPI